MQVLETAPNKYQYHAVTVLKPAKNLPSNPTNALVITALICQEAEH